MSLLTYMSPMSAAKELNGERISTGDGLSVSLTLLLTVRLLPCPPLGFGVLKVQGLGLRV